MSIKNSYIQRNLPAHSIKESELVRFSSLVRLMGLIEQIETFDLIRHKYIRRHYNLMLRTRDHRVSKRRWSGFLTQYLLKDIEADARLPSSIIKHPLSNESKEVNDYKIGSSIITGSNFTPVFSLERTMYLEDYICDQDLVLYLNGEPFFSANLWRPSYSKTIREIVEKVGPWTYTKNSPFIFGKRKYFKDHILPPTIEILNEYEKFYSDLKIHTVYFYDGNEEVNRFHENLEQFFKVIPNISDLKYYY